MASRCFWACVLLSLMSLSPATAARPVAGDTHLPVGSARPLMRGAEKRDGKKKSDGTSWIERPAQMAAQKGPKMPKPRTQNQEVLHNQQIPVAVVPPVVPVPVIQPVPVPVKQQTPVPIITSVVPAVVLPQQVPAKALPMVPHPRAKGANNNRVPKAVAAADGIAQKRGVRKVGGPASITIPQANGAAPIVMQPVHSLHATR